MGRVRSASPVHVRPTATTNTATVPYSASFQRRPGRARRTGTEASSPAGATQAALTSPS